MTRSLALAVAVIAGCGSAPDVDAGWDGGPMRPYPALSTVFTVRNGGRDVSTHEFAGRVGSCELQRNDALFVVRARFEDESEPDTYFSIRFLQLRPCVPGQAPDGGTALMEIGVNPSGDRSRSQPRVHRHSTERRAGALRVEALR